MLKERLLPSVGAQTGEVNGKGAVWRSRLQLEVVRVRESGVHEGKADLCQAVLAAHRVPLDRRRLNGDALFEKTKGGENAFKSARGNEFHGVDDCLNKKMGTISTNC